MTHDDDLATLRERFSGWRFTVTWVTAASGADARLLHAQRGSVVLTSRTPADLAAQIEDVPESSR